MNDVSEKLPVRETSAIRSGDSADDGRQERPWKCSFSEAVCDRFHCTPGNFQRTVFWNCFSRHTLFIGKLIFFFNSDFFVDDWEAIKRFGLVRSSKEFDDELNDLDYVVRRQAGFLRYSIGIRVSLRKLSLLRSQVLS